ncbi:Yip1 domain protein [Planococcus massiliensis]|uniref:Yip1 domain protein n=1 Tax=Planococcus massiliensis TaxID=1499687 RepID=A0A098EKF7_9BACL|nr:YIP1 family protein [Planococcus massiliensis]CEG22854.1 Yip1 domain protein [Planococcus massiliensis]
MDKLEKERQLNPFTAIWLHTREAIRWVLATKAWPYFFFLLYLAGISAGFISLSQSAMLELPLGAALLFAFVIAPVLLLIASAFMSVLYLWFGKIMKGSAAYKDVFKAVIAGLIPQIWLLPLILFFWIIAPEIFLSLTPKEDPFHVFLYAAYFVILMATSLWSIVIQSKGLAEAHRMATWKGFLTLLVPSAVMWIIMTYVIILLVFALAGF